MNINIDRILRDPRQDLFVYDTDYFCPEPSIEFYTKLVVLDLLATLRECENPEKKVLDGADRIDYNRFVNTICERFNIPWKDTSPSPPKGIISQPTV
jgi:hypothetical protein